MKTIGLVGGTGWISSVEYYTMINTTHIHSRAAVGFVLDPNLEAEVLIQKKFIKE